MNSARQKKKIFWLANLRSRAIGLCTVHIFELCQVIYIGNINDCYSQSHAFTNQIKAKLNQVRVSSPENIPLEVTAIIEFSPLHVHLCLFIKFDPLPYTVYSLYKLVFYSKLSYTSEHVCVQYLSFIS
jgi:hypothetical protein